MFEKFESILLFSRSLWITILIFSILSLFILFLLIYHILSKQQVLMGRSKGLQLIINSINRFFSKFFLIPSDAKSEGLFKSLTLLKDFLHNNNYKYQLPWTLMIGGKNSGKSFLNQGLSGKFQPAIKSVIAKDESCIWNFFTSGVVMDVNSDLVMYKENGVFTSNDDEWSELLYLLTNHRSVLPLDNIALTISIEDLLESSEEELILQADYLFYKVWVAKKISSLNLPIYMIFTHLDKLPGFSSFVSTLTQDQKEDMFGWSSEYEMNVLPENWHTNMFEEIMNRLNEIQIYINAHVDDSQVNSDVMMFVSSFENIKSKLFVLCQQLSRTGYDTSLFIRGVYFTGKYEEKAVFASRLFEEKIFAERGIARFLSQSWLSTNTKVKTLQILTGSVISLGAIDLYWQYRYLGLDMQMQTNTMDALHKTIRHTKQLKLSDDDGHIRAANFYLSTLKVMDFTQLKVYTNPISWIAPIEYDLERALIQSCQFLLINQMDKVLNHKLYKFATQTALHVPTFESENDFDNPKSKPAKLLIDFINVIYLFVLADEKMQDMDVAANVTDMTFVFWNLFDTKLKLDQKHLDIYRYALAKSGISPIVWERYKNDLHKALDTKLDIFVKYMLEPEYACKCVFDLRRELHKLNQGSGDLIAIKDNIKKVVQMLNNSRDIIVSDSKKFHMSTKWDVVRKQIDRIRYILGDYKVREMHKKLDKEYMKLKNFLMNEKLPVIGFLLQKEPGGSYKVSDDLLKLMGLLNTMSVEGLTVSNKKDKELKSLLFNQGKLASDSGDYGSHTLSVVLDLQKLSNAMEKVRRFQKLAVKELYILNDKHMLYKATLDTLISELEGTLFTDGDVGDQFIPEQFKACSGFLEQLLTFLNEQTNNQNAIILYSRLKNSLVDIIAKASRKAYGKLQDKNLYKMADSSIDPTGYDASQLQDYCDAQVRHMKNIVNPVKPYLHMGDFILNQDSTTSFDHSVRVLIDVYKQLDKFADKEGDVFELNSIIKKIFSDKDVFKAIDDASWMGGGGYFSKKFHEMIEGAKELANKAKVTLFNKDYDPLRSFFKQNLSGKFPFSKTSDALEARFSDVLEYYKMYDEFSKKYTDEVLKLYDIKPLKTKLDFLDRMKKMRPWLETLAKNAKTDFSLVFETRRRSDVEKNFDQMSQWVISCDDKRFDFRSDLIAFPYIQHNALRMIFKLAEGSSAMFESGSKEHTIDYSGGWGFMKMMYDYKTAQQTNDLLLKMPMKRYVNDKKHLLQLMASMKVSLVQDKSVIPWEDLPVEAPDL